MGDETVKPRTSAEVAASRDRLISMKNLLELEVSTAKRRAAGGGGFANAGWLSQSEYKVSEYKRQIQALQVEAAELRKDERRANAIAMRRDRAREAASNPNTFAREFMRQTKIVVPSRLFEILMEKTQEAIGESEQEPFEGE